MRSNNGSSMMSSSMTTTTSVTSVSSYLLNKIGDVELSRDDEEESKKNPTFDSTFSSSTGTFYILPSIHIYITVQDDAVEASVDSTWFATNPDDVWTLEHQQQYASYASSSWQVFQSQSQPDNDAPTFQSVEWIDTTNTRQSTEEESREGEYMIKQTNNKKKKKKKDDDDDWQTILSDLQETEKIIAIRSSSLITGMSSSPISKRNNNNDDDDASSFDAIAQEAISILAKHKTSSHLLQQQQESENENDVAMGTTTKLGNKNNKNKGDSGRWSDSIPWDEMQDIVAATIAMK